MSTGQDCGLQERNPGEWYLLLENREDEDYDEYGPFDDMDAALRYLNRFANPGGFWVERYTPPAA